MLCIYSLGKIPTANHGGSLVEFLCRKLHASDQRADSNSSLAGHSRKQEEKKQTRFPHLGENTMTLCSEF